MRHIIILSISLIFSFGFGQTNFKYPGCADLQPSDFEFEQLFTKESLNGDLHEAVKMDFDMDASGVVDVYFIELRDEPKVPTATGRVRVYRGATGQIENIVEITVSARQNDGLFAFVLDPDFKNNGWFYVGYQVPKEFPDRPENTVFRLSRFTISGSTALPSSEAILLEVPAFWQKIHTGGGLQFDDYGNLWFGIGDNQKVPPTASTATLVGKIIRITPLPVPEGNQDFGPGKSYTIPEGNMADFFFKKFETSDPSRAAEYLDSSMVKREIYAMGVRNPYTITLDPVREWMSWGDCGPDHTNATTEEWNLITEPGNHGWPFYAGDTVDLMVARSELYGMSWSPRDPNNIINDLDENNGLIKWPPLADPTYHVQGGCAMTGPIYRYDPLLPSSSKMPPHFNRVWFITNFNRTGVIIAHRMDEEGNLIETEDLSKLIGPFENYKPLDFKAGPDGAFYFANYGRGGWYDTPNSAGFARVKYKGNCRPGFPEYPMLEKVGCKDQNYLEFDPLATHNNTRDCINLRPDALISAGALRNNLNLRKLGSDHFEIQFPTQKNYQFEVVNSLGKVVISKEVSGNQWESFKINNQKGLYFLKVYWEGELLVKKLAVY